MRYLDIVVHKCHSTANRRHPKVTFPDKGVGLRIWLMGVLPGPMHRPDLVPIDDDLQPSDDRYLGSGVKRITVAAEVQ